MNRFRVIGRGETVLFFEFSREVVNAGEAKHVADFRDCAVVFLNQKLRMVELEIGDVLLRADVQICSEQVLQGRAGNGEFRAQIFDSECRADVVVDVNENFVEQGVFVMLLHRIDARIGFFLVIKLVEQNNDFFEIKDGKFLIEVVFRLNRLHEGTEHLIDVLACVEDTVSQRIRQAVIHFENNCQIGTGLIRFRVVGMELTGIVNHQIVLGKRIVIAIYIHFK